MRTVSVTLLLLIFLMAQTNNLQAQLLEHTLPFNVVSYDPATMTLAVDAVSPDAEDLSTFTLEPTTLLTDRRENPVTAEDLRPGCELKASWIEENYVNHLRSLQVMQSWSNATMDHKGLLDFVDTLAGIAVVGGERITLDPGVMIEGDGGLKGPYPSFGALTLGNTIEVTGLRDANGLVHVSKATVKPNKVDKGWKKVLKHLDEQFSYKYIVWNGNVVAVKGQGMFGTGGYAEFNNARQTIVADPELQAYVNTVGLRVVPDWMEGMPTSAQQRTDFRFMVVDNENFSLYSLPNGMVFVSTGALAQVENEAQLASLLAREVAHVLCRHTQERNELMENVRAAIWSAMKVKMIAKDGPKAALQAPDDVLLDILTMLVFQGAQGDMKAAAEQGMSFLPAVIALPERSKKDLLGILYNLRGVASPLFGGAAESEADRIALSYMFQAGYDPREAGQVWKPFVKLTLGDGMQVLTQGWTTYMQGPKPFEGPNTLKDAGSSLLGAVVGAAADNWFGDRARCRKRFANMNLLVATGYGSVDLSATKQEADAFAPMKEKAKALLTTN